MRNLTIYFLIVQFAFGLGCRSEEKPRRKDESRSNLLNTNSRPSSFFTEDQVKKGIVSGMSRDDLVHNFGEPLFEMKGENGVSYLEYQAPIERNPLPKDFEFSGFEVSMKSNKVIAWNPVHSDTQVHKEKGKNDHDVVTDSKDVVSSNILFYIVNEEKIPKGKYIDTQELPRLGFISPDAELRISALKSLRRGEVGGGISSKPALILEMKEPDAALFYNVTRKNIGKKFLIEIDGEPVVAPIIMAPIATGEFEIIQGDKTFKKIEEKLKRFVR